MLKRDSKQAHGPKAHHSGCKHSCKNNIICGLFRDKRFIVDRNVTTKFIYYVYVIYYNHVFVIGIKMGVENLVKSHSRLFCLVLPTSHY